MLCLPAGFPPVPQYPLRTVASPHPSQNRACATHAHGSSTTRFAEEVTIGSPEFAGEATGSVGAAAGTSRNSDCHAFHAGLAI